MSSTVEKLALAQRHLERVQVAWDEPTDWDDLSLYGFYALEAAVDAACIRLGIRSPRMHSGRVDSAAQLALEHGLPDISELLRDLNDARKSVAYGDTELPDLDAETTANGIEGFIDDVRVLIEGNEGP